MSRIRDFFPDPARVSRFCTGRPRIAHLEAQFEVSERWAAEVVEQPWSTQRYEPHEADEEGPSVRRVLELVRLHARYGYRRIWALMRRDGFAVNRKRVWRLWRRERLKVPKKQRNKRRLGTSANGCVRQPAVWDQVWTWDFVHDRTTDGK